MSSVVKAWILVTCMAVAACDKGPSVTSTDGAQVYQSICATCHDVMDPIGLGLENFDAVGKWRTREPGGEIDAHGQLANGTPISGAAELREALTADPEQFARVFTSKLLTYALGRGLEAYDMPTVRKIVREAEDRAVVDINARFRALGEKRALLRVAEMAQSTAREKVRVKTNQYQVQAAMLNDVLQLRAELAGADDRYQQALLAFWTAKADFELAIGEEVIR